MNNGAWLHQIMQAETHVEYLENILESLDQSIAVTDQQWHVLIWNSKMTTNFFPKEKAVQQTLQALFPSFWQEYRGQIWGDVLAAQVMKLGQPAKIVRFPLPAQDGKIRYFDIHGSPLKNSQQDVLGLILILNDVSDNIALENQLVRQARTTSLANLGASIAHEIRNPLNSISLNIQLIKEWLATPQVSQNEVQETLDNVLSEIRRLDELIRDFLRFSRPPQPQLILEDPNTAVKQALRLLAEPAKKQHVEIITNFGELPNVMMDRNQLSQAIYNICLNGIQALQEQGGGRLEVSTLDRLGFVVIEIKDDGLGLSLPARDNLFNLFFTTKEDGSGMGLPIANQIVERHDGKIVAENNVDRGACFSIYLPVPNKKAS